MLDVTEAKKAWRRLAVDMFTLVGRDDRRRLDGILCERVREYVFGSGAACLLGYAPMSDEPDLSPFLRHWVEEGGRLALPVWLGGRNMRLKEVTDFNTQLRPGRGGILEPVEECRDVDPAELELCITPGRFFSEECERLGRGAGCYDQLFLQQGMTALGVAYEFQVFPRLPMDEYDRPVDVVLTPTRLITRTAENKAFVL